MRGCQGNEWVASAGLGWAGKYSHWQSSPGNLAVPEYLPYAEHLRESICCAPCFLLHQTKARHDSSFISTSFLGILMNPGNLSPVMTRDFKSEASTHIFRMSPWSGFSGRCTPCWLAVSQSHISNHFFLPASQLPRLIYASSKLLGVTI